MKEMNPMGVFAPSSLDCFRTIVRAKLAVSSTALLAFADDNAALIAVPVESGLVAFSVGTNVSAVSVHGKASAATGVVRARRDGAQVRIEEVTVLLPVEALTTGMSLRDEHMKKYIFTTADKKTPELRFSSGTVSCVLDSNCKVAGTLSIRGLERPFSISLKVKAAGAGYRAVGDSVVKLSDYGIERPSQFGVRCSDEVKIHIHFHGKGAQ
jgi:polyisoprenoid-binding protein YceI